MPSTLDTSETGRAYRSPGDPDSSHHLWSPVVRPRGLIRSHVVCTTTHVPYTSPRFPPPSVPPSHPQEVLPPRPTRNFPSVHSRDPVLVPVSAGVGRTRYLTRRPCPHNPPTPRVLRSGCWAPEFTVGLGTPYKVETPVVAVKIRPLLLPSYDPRSRTVSPPTLTPLARSPGRPTVLEYVSYSLFHRRGPRVT